MKRFLIAFFVTYTFPANCFKDVFKQGYKQDFAKITFICAVG